MHYNGSYSKKPPPKSFYQTNPEQAYELYKVAMDMAEIKKDELVFDLYTGTGTIALFMAEQAREVVGIELIPEAIEDAKLNAQNNGVTNATFYAGDMKEVFNAEFIAKHGKPDVLFSCESKKPFCKIHSLFCSLNPMLIYCCF